MKVKLLILFLLTLSACSSKTYYKVVGIHDADTITVSDYNCSMNCKVLRVRLLGIDSPELDQESWGLKAKEFTEKELKGEKIIIEQGISPTDKYGRTLGYIFYDFNESGKAKLLNEELLESGFAVIYLFPDENKYNSRLKTAEYKARGSKLNIWDEENGLQQSPAKYRSEQKRKQNANRNK